ncbi:YnbE family lipoprotein [Alteriqipengyuania sp. 357]
MAKRLGPIGGLCLLGGCVNVNAPSEPIVIELNINIQQEVIYRLAADVEENIEANPGIF